MEKWKTLQNAWKSKPFSGRFPLSHRLYDNDEKHLLPIKNVSTFNQDLTGVEPVLSTVLSAGFASWRERTGFHARIEEG